MQLCCEEEEEVPWEEEEVWEEVMPWQVLEEMPWQVLEGMLLEGWEEVEEPPLLQALQNGLIREAENLLSSGADVNVRSPFDGSAALHTAALSGRSGVALTLLEHGADKDALDDVGDTPLMKASERGNQAVVYTLLAAGAKFNIRSKHDGRSALLLAATHGHEDIVYALFESGADVDMADHNGHTPLIWACRGNHLRVVDSLLYLGAKHNIRSTGSTDGEDVATGVTALHVAAGNGYSAIVDRLLGSRADTTVADDDKETPLIWAGVCFVPYVCVTVHFYRSHHASIVFFSSSEQLS